MTGRRLRRRGREASRAPGLAMQWLFAEASAIAARVKAARADLAPAIGDRQVRVIASAELVQRDGSVVIASGIRRRPGPTPLLLDHASLCAGAVGATQVETLDDGTRVFVAAAGLPRRGVSQAVDQAWDAIALGLGGSVSIGFDEVEKSDEPILAGQFGPTYRAIELKEISLLTKDAPNNPRARVDAIGEFDGESWRWRSVKALPSGTRVYRQLPPVLVRTANGLAWFIPKPIAMEVR